jgi:hypothetical protein
VLFAFVAAMSTQCAYDGAGNEPTGSAVQDLNANSHTAFDYFLGKGLTAVQAAGIIGNLMQESNCDPTAVQPGGPGRGIAQWSAGGRWDTDRGDNVVAYASMHGASSWALGLQLDFIWYELTTFSGYGLAQLRASTTVSAATIAFETRFEGCGTCAESTRISYANQALSAYGGDATVAWGGQFVSQSFPYASAGSVSIAAGGAATISITMHNSGTHAWDGHTCIGTTLPRDRSSVFAGPEWPGPNRPACVPSGSTVAAGANHTFTWVMHAPTMTGRYDEHWGMVEDGVTWFSDPGAGGPPDNDLEGIFTVTPAPPPPPPPPPPADAGVHDAGVADAEADAAHDAESSTDAAVSHDAASGDAGAAGDASEAGHADVAGDRGGDSSTATAPAGCSARPARGSRNAGAELALLALAAAVTTRRRWRRGHGRCEGDASAPRA